MPWNYEYHFEIKPGKFVFVPTKTCLKEGQKIVNKVRADWSPHKIFYHFGKRGGHVAAMRLHLDHTYFAKIDLTQFFTSVTRVKVVRSLKKIGFINKEAFEIAVQSVVEYDGKKFLPYGFVQSMALATLCVEFSALGSVLKKINDEGVLISMYVDDILLSSDSKEKLQIAFDNILMATENSNFSANDDKCIRPCKIIEIFNCDVSKDKMVIVDERMEKFRHDFAVGNDYTQAAIARYIEVVNEEQLEELYASFT